MFKRNVKIFGRSISLAVIMLLVCTIGAIAALYVYLSHGISGSILASPIPPTITLAFTNDDNIIDGSMDPGDTGPDPYTGYISDGPGIGHVDRVTFDTQTCTVAINGGGTTADIVIKDGYEGELGPSYCTVFMDLENNTGQDLELSTVEIIDAPLVVTNYGGCGIAIPNGEGLKVLLDVHVAEGAPGGAFTGGTISMKWNYPGTYTCP